jgi:hypothetical protein
MRARRFTLLLLIALCLQSKAEEKGDEACKEAQLAAAALSKLNETLRAEIGRLREELAKLTMELARAKANLDEAKVAGAGKGQSSEQSVDTASTTGEAASRSWLITDVNPDLKLVVFEAGRASGVKQGMTLYALRGEKPGARLRVVDVRERMTGAVIEEILGSGSPEKGDRVVLMSAPK